MQKKWIGIICLIFFLSCQQETKVKIRGSALGTTYQVQYYTQGRKNFKPEFDSIFSVINNSISTYLQNSDISKINRGQKIKVDEHFVKVFETSKKVHKITNSYFDPSIGPLVNSYGFGPEQPIHHLHPKQIDSLMRYVGFQHFSLDNNQLQTNIETFYLDFNAIGKGYAVDVIAEHLKSNMINNFFVEIGGEIYASGMDTQKETPWIFGIEKPEKNSSNREWKHKITLHNNGLATSGNYRKFKIDSITGKKYVHTINPKTGKAEQSNLLSASVIAESCMLADAYATAFMAMGAEQSIKIVNNHNIKALLVYVDEDQKLNTFVSKNLQDNLSK